MDSRYLQSFVFVVELGYRGSSAQTRPHARRRGAAREDAGSRTRRDARAARWARPKPASASSCARAVLHEIRDLRSAIEDAGQLELQKNKSYML